MCGNRIKETYFCTQAKFFKKIDKNPRKPVEMRHQNVTYTLYGITCDWRFFLLLGIGLFYRKSAEVFFLKVLGRGPNRRVVKLCSPYPRLFFFGITNMIGVDSCVFLIFTTRVGLNTRLNGVKLILFEQSRVELQFEIVRKESVSRTSSETHWKLRLFRASP